MVWCIIVWNSWQELFRTDIFLWSVPVAKIEFLYSMVVIICRRVLMNVFKYDIIDCIVYIRSILFLSSKICGWLTGYWTSRFLVITLGIRWHGWSITSECCKMRIWCLGGVFIYLKIMKYKIFYGRYLCLKVVGFLVLNTKFILLIFSQFVYILTSGGATTRYVLNRGITIALIYSTFIGRSLLGFFDC